MRGELALHATQHVLNPVKDVSVISYCSEPPCERWRFMGVEPSFIHTIIYSSPSDVTSEENTVFTRRATCCQNRVRLHRLHFCTVLKYQVWIFTPPKVTLCEIKSISALKRDFWTHHIEFWHLSLLGLPECSNNVMDYM